MENLKHTKGEWFINPNASRNVRCGNKTIANCSSGQDGENEIEEKANAKLIASAPKLLEALIEAKEQIEHLAWKINKDGSDFAKVTTKEALKQIENAINKATK